MITKSFRFEIIHASKKSRARVGRIHTAHGIIDTPNFVGVGTNSTMKALDNKTVSDLGLQLMFCNTYHLMLQPGSSVIKNAGGIHQFSNRTLPIITDSGGFQVFSLAYGGVTQEIKSKGTKKQDGQVIKITEEGVLFRSYRDGAKFLLSAESSIAAQKDIGADIMISFDELLPYHTDNHYHKASFARTHRWEERSLRYHQQHPTDQALYAVIHGGIDKTMRKASCDHLTALDFDGYAVGGSVGKNHQEMIEMLTFTMPCLPTDKPNHLLGIGDLKSLEHCIPLGIDTFDSSYPTQTARHGLLITKNGTMRILKSGNNQIFRPIEEDCTCYTCRNFTVAYLFHLFKAHELTAYTLATIHNLHAMVMLMQRYREAILNDQL